MRACVRSFADHLAAALARGLLRVCKSICMGARRRKVNQQAAAGLDTQTDYFDSDRIAKTPAKRDRTWYSLATALLLAVALTVWGALYVVHKALKH